MTLPPGAVTREAAEDRTLTGVGLMLGAYLVFTCIDTCAKWLILSGMPTMTVVFVRYAVHAVIVLAFFLPTRGRRLFSTRAPLLETVRAGCLLASTIFNFSAVSSNTSFTTSQSSRFGTSFTPIDFLRLEGGSSCCAAPASSITSMALSGRKRSVM